MIRFSQFSLFGLLLTSAQGQQIDLVQLGAETFQAVGCAECHAVASDDASIKTGPSLFGRFQPTPIEKLVQGGDAQHKVKFDLKYLTDSLRTPTQDLAIAESGPSKGQPFLPVMPPYDASILPEQKVEALYHYLQTLNEEGQQGPAKVMAAKKADAAPLTALTDPAEVLVADQTRIFRARLGKTSARAVHVGMPNGLNYSFDPRTLSVERIWWGGFLNLKQEMTSRGGKDSNLGEQAEEVKLGSSLLAPLDPTTGKPVDLTFKSPTYADNAQIIANMSDDVDFLEQVAASQSHFRGYMHAEVPTFFYQIGDNELEFQFTVSNEGAAKITIDGKLSQPQTFQLSEIIHGKSEKWTVSELPAELAFQLPIKPAWRPWQAQTNRAPQAVKTSVPAKLELPAGYSAETIAPPLDIHGREQLFEPMGMDEAADGSLIISTRTSGLWKLKDGTWTQIAEGLLDSLGLIIEDEKTIVVGQKPELTRLRDVDGDGWFDRYETIWDDFLFTHNYHEYLHGPAKGTDGNYYVQLNLGHRGKPEVNYMAGGKYMGTQGGLRGWALQITPEGKMTPYANGLRSPAGLATGPDGALYYTENQGEYVGTSKLFRLEQDKFYGNPCGLIDLPGMTPQSPEIAWDTVKGTKEKALALMAHSHLANAPGSPAWAPADGKFGPFGGQMFVGDQTLSQLFRILPKEGNEAALIPFAKGFSSGVMRLLFAKDHSLYAGQTGRGWRAQGGQEDGLVRIFRNEQSLGNELLDITRDGNDFVLHYSKEIESAPTAEQLRIMSWDYHDSPNYGSGELNKATLTTTKIEAKGKSLHISTTGLSKSDDNTVIRFQSLIPEEEEKEETLGFYSISRR
ncbi:c-type cytochrome [Roseibacillus persicicus]|uniref:Cytochrome c domain-containing protein n=1 Tax=Roseibacillus persicicus TaxID=454148 RepID=A0A918TD56_9BACT|nr:c-type cytochrome [Roseibacillus persicicus]GHC40226.1 hypothetical protein GCM10007100_00760 [Roseibacillus persicicus]